MLTAEDIAIDRATAPGRLERAERALAEVLAFISDVNGTDPAVRDWHIKHAVAVKSAAERFDRLNCLSDHSCYRQGPQTSKACRTCEFDGDECSAPGGASDCFRGQGNVLHSWRPRSAAPDI